MAVSGTINTYLILWHYTDLNLRVSSRRSRGRSPFLPSFCLPKVVCMTGEGRRKWFVVLQLHTDGRFWKTGSNIYSGTYIKQYSCLYSSSSSRLPPSPSVRYSWGVTEGHKYCSNADCTGLLSAERVDFVTQLRLGTAAGRTPLFHAWQIPSLRERLCVTPWSVVFHASADAAGFFPKTHVLTPGQETSNRLFSVHRTLVHPPQLLGQLARV